MVFGARSGGTYIPSRRGAETMTRNPKNPRTETTKMLAATPAYRPFTRLEEHRPATTDDFVAQGMGIAAKE